jgi:hypothetical protein
VTNSSVKQENILILKLRKLAVLDALRREGSLATETSIYPY